MSWIGALFEHASHVALTPTLKTDRGFEHEFTGRLLCPVDYNWGDVTQVIFLLNVRDGKAECPHHPSSRVQQNIREGHPDFMVTADLWPSFLYPNSKGDINNIEENLFKSAILLKVSSSILSWCYTLTSFRHSNSFSPPQPLHRALIQRRIWMNQRFAHQKNAAIIERLQEVMLLTS